MKQISTTDLFEASFIRYKDPSSFSQVKIKENEKTGRRYARVFFSATHEVQMARSIYKSPDLYKEHDLYIPINILVAYRDNFIKMVKDSYENDD